MTPRENMMAILNGEQPEYYGDLMDAIVLVPDPVAMRDRCPQDGKPHADTWGCMYEWPVGAPGPHPIVNDENAVIKDIEKWEEQLHVPSLDNLDWGPAKEVANSVDRKEKFVGLMFGGGLFERSHHLQGMQVALENYLTYPEETAALLRKIADFKIAYIRQMAEEIHPDIIFYHDDWGFKRNLFLPPQVWREIIKPLQFEISQAIHDGGMIYMHHADCFCQPIVEDMVELGIDIWQGVIPQNDIVAIQKITNHKLAMVGGIDVPLIDVAGTPEEAIRAEVRRAYDTYLPGGRFFPGMPSACCYIKEIDDIAKDEARRYGRIWAQEHPIVK